MPQAPQEDTPGFGELKLIRDEPVLEHEKDWLNFRPYAETIAGIGLGTPGPFTIGVFGEWGTGKTSLMRVAKDLIDAKAKEKRSQFSHVVTVWFNAWQYEREEHPIVPLIGSIVKTIEDKGSAFVKKTKGVLNALRAVAYGFSAKAKVGLPGLGQVEAGLVAKEMVDRYEKLSESPVDPILDRSLYFRAFDTLSRAEGKLKTVVFVDDLDRCMPEKAVHLLEAIKLVLAQEGFVFVLGVARRILEEFITHLYRDEYKITGYGREGRSYLDKIIQLPMWLPASEENFAAFLRRRVTETEALDDDHKRTLVEHVVPHLQGACELNPRAAVRLLNDLIVAVYLWRQKNKERLPDETLKMVAVSRAVQQFDDRLYRYLVKEQPWKGEPLLEQLRAIDKVERKERGEPVEAAEPPPSALPGTEWAKRVLENRLLRRFLCSPIGAPWLENEQARDEVEKLLALGAAERPEEARASEEPPAPPTGRRARVEDVVVRTIREACQSEGKRANELEELSLPAGADGEWSNLRHLTSLKKLDLGGTRVTDAGLEHLKALNGLERLQLVGTQVTDAGLQHLKTLSSLQKLDLTLTGVTGAGLQHLKTLTSLQTLYLRNTQVTDAGLEQLKTLTSLQSLDLGGTGVTDAGLEHLKSLTSLQGLGLMRTQVTDAGLEHLKGLTSLRTLDLSDTQVTDAGLEHLKSLTSLQRLYLRGTQVTDAGVGKLKAALPELKVYR